MKLYLMVEALKSSATPIVGARYMLVVGLPHRVDQHGRPQVVIIPIRDKESR